MGSHFVIKSLLLIKILVVVLSCISIVAESNINKSQNMSGFLMGSRNGSNSRYYYGCYDCVSSGETDNSYSCTYCNYDTSNQGYIRDSLIAHPGTILGIINASVFVIVGFIVLCCFLGSCCCFQYRRQTMSQGQVYVPQPQGNPMPILQLGSTPQQQQPIIYYEPALAQPQTQIVQGTGTLRTRQPHLVTSAA